MSSQQRKLKDKLKAFIWQEVCASP
uniref:Uncharacterized protein n=1 Tax=Rhizophora mucronata TaxID=61149 RepID=A0A2P2PW73_RHIMU